LRIHRVLASIIDGLAALAAGLLLSDIPGIFLAERAFVALDIGNPDGFWRGPVPLILGYAGTFVHALPVAFLLLLIPEGFAGAGPGKLVTGLRVSGARPLRRFLLKTGGWWLHLLGLVAAFWPLLALGVLWNLTVLLGSAPLLFGRDTLHDRLAGTRVSR